MIWIVLGGMALVVWVTVATMGTIGLLSYLWERHDQSRAAARVAELTAITEGLRRAQGFDQPPATNGQQPSMWDLAGPQFPSDVMPPWERAELEGQAPDEDALREERVRREMEAERTPAPPGESESEWG